MKKMIAVLTGTLALASTGCGKLSNIVTDVRYQAYSDPNGVPITKVEFDINAGGLLLPALNIPIVNPNNPSQIYATVSMSDIVGGGTMLAVNADLNAIRNGGTMADGCRLPNGHDLPVRMPAGVPCAIGLPIGNSGRLYIAFTDTIALVGAAVVIREFDAAGGPLQGADIFPPFSFANGIRGVAGLFTSLTPSQSGVAVFADITSVIPRVKSAGGLALSVERNSPASSVTFAPDTTSSKTMKNAQKALGKLKGKRLSTN